MHPTTPRLGYPMAWIGRSQGYFQLHDSDDNCGSFMRVSDAAEILGVDETALEPFVRREQAPDGHRVVSELDLHRRWGSGEISSPHPPRIRGSTRSFDEIVLMSLLRLAYPGATVTPQVAIGRKSVDLVVEHNSTRIAIEFLGPSHFIQSYQRPLQPPLERRDYIEQALGHECVLWPYWIQRCVSNVRVLFNDADTGLASVWSTKAHFGDFGIDGAGSVIEEITRRFRAWR